MKYIRKRRSVSGSSSPCSCSTSLELNKFNILTLKQLNQTKVDVAINEIKDVYSNPLYDILQVSVQERKVANRYVKITNEKHYLYVDARECDCTSIIKPGNFTLTGEERNGDIIHGVLAKMIKQKGKDEKDNKVMLIALITAAVIVVMSASILIAFVCKRKMMPEEDAVKGGVDNDAYVTTDEKQ